MCHTRDILQGFKAFFYHSDRPKPPIQTVKPKKALLVTSMICEIKAAEITNSAVYEMEKNEIGNVAYRFLQSRRGENNTFNEILFWSTASLILFELGYKIHPILYLCLLCYAPHIPPNIGNTLRYKETKNYCAEWLTQKLGIETFEKIKELKFNRAGMFKLSSLLNEKNINASHLENKIDKEERFQCCNRDR